MKINWKIALVIIVVIVLVIMFFGAGYLNLGSKSPETGVQAPTINIESATPPAATGNIDDVVDSLLQDSSNEATAFNEEILDANLINSDDQAISDFGQSYETQF